MNKIVVYFAFLKFWFRWHCAEAYCYNKILSANKHLMSLWMLT